MMAADIKTALNEVIGGSDLLEDLIARHFAPHYRQRTNGIWDEFAGFKEHISHLREVVRRIDVTVLDEVTDDERYSSRHAVDIVKTDGSLVKQEVYLFGEQNVDGKFTRVEEVIMMLEGTESDRGFGNARWPGQDRADVPLGPTTNLTRPCQLAPGSTSPDRVATNYRICTTIDEDRLTGDVAILFARQKR